MVSSIELFNKFLLSNKKTSSPNRSIDLKSGQ